MTDNPGWKNVKENSFAGMEKEEQKRIASAGGKASGEARRKKKLMKEQMAALLSLEVKNKNTRKRMKTLGIDPEDMDNQMALCAAMLKEGLKGNVKAFNAIRDTLGEMPDEAEVEVENITNFLKAINPTQDELNDLFSDGEEEGAEDGQEKEKADKV